MQTAANLLNSVGVNVHLYDRTPSPYANMAMVESCLGQLPGLIHLRDDLNLSTVIDQSTYFYQNIRTLAGLGYKFSMVCWDALNPFFFSPPDKIVPAYGWCIDPVTGNAGIEQFEGSNEPGLVQAASRNPDVSRYLQTQLYFATRGAPATKNLPVLGPSYVYTGCVMSNHQDIRESVAPYCNVVNFHPYPGMEQPETTSQFGGLANLLAWARSNTAGSVQDVAGGTKVAQATEYGYHTSLQDPSSDFGVSEAIKTRYLPRSLLFAFANGIQRTYVYQLIDDLPFDPSNRQTSFGLFDYAGNIKASGSAVKNLLALCAPRSPGVIPVWGFSLSGDQADMQTVLVSRADGSAVLFCWLGVSGWDNVNKVALAPVTRPCVLTVTGHSPTAVVGHLFNDDGTVATASLSPAGGGFALTLSDQLMAVELIP